jgi:hypothetical protein
MSGVEWPIPPQRTSDFVNEGLSSRVAKSFSAGSSTAETQITIVSTGEVDSSGTCEFARNDDKTFTSCPDTLDAIFEVVRSLNFKKLEPICLDPGSDTVLNKVKCSLS